MTVLSCTLIQLLSFIGCKLTFTRATFFISGIYRNTNNYCSDPGLLSRYCAAKLNIHENYLVQKVAEILGYRYLSRVPRPAISAEYIDLQVCEKFSCLPVQRNNIFEGIACTNPDIIPENFKQACHNRFFLISCGSFRRCLDELRSEIKKELPQQMLSFSELSGLECNYPQPISRSQLEPVLPSISEISIIIIDDQISFLRASEKLLSNSGYKVRAFLSVEEAITWLNSSNQPPAIVVSDIHMNGASGFEFINYLRAKYTTPIPVVLLTSDTSTETELLAIKSDVAAIVDKLKDPEILLTNIRKIISREAL